MSTTNTSFNNDTDMTKFKRTLLSQLMYLSLDGCLSPEAFLRVGWVFQTLQSRITSIELSDNFDDEFPPLPESYRHAIDSDNKSHLPMGGGNSIISKLPEDCVKEVFNHSPENPIDETSNILSETDITAAALVTAEISHLPDQSTTKSSLRSISSSIYCWLRLLSDISITCAL